MKPVRIVIKGAGEMASGIAHRLYMANLTDICMTEIEKPLAVRRKVAFCEAVYEGSMEVEGVAAELVRNVADIEQVWGRRRIAVVVDPEWEIVARLKPDVVVDAIMAKRNTGTRREEAPLVIGVGPGFVAPADVHVVVESNRGHDLGRTIYEGEAEPYTAMPGLKAGYTKERVLRSPHGGAVRSVKSIGEAVRKGEIVTYVDGTPVPAAIGGVVRGLIRDIHVGHGEKIGDIEPTGVRSYCFTVSEKARAIAGGVLEAIMHHLNREDRTG